MMCYYLNVQFQGQGVNCSYDIDFVFILLAYSTFRKTAHWNIVTSLLLKSTAPQQPHFLQASEISVL